MVIYTLIYLLYIAIEAHLLLNRKQVATILRNERAINKNKYKLTVTFRVIVGFVLALTLLEKSLLQALLLFVCVVDLYIYLKQTQIHMRG